MFLGYPDALCAHFHFFKYLAGHSLLLISVARQLFSHVWEVVKDGPSFQLEYSMILRQLLAVKEYRYQMKPRTYISEFPYQGAVCSQ